MSKGQVLWASFKTFSYNCFKVDLPNNSEKHFLIDAKSAFKAPANIMADSTADSMLTLLWSPRTKNLSGVAGAEARNSINCSEARIMESELNKIRTQKHRLGEEPSNRL